MRTLPTTNPVLRAWRLQALRSRLDVLRRDPVAMVQHAFSPPVASNFTSRIDGQEYVQITLDNEPLEPGLEVTVTTAKPDGLVYLSYWDDEHTSGVPPIITIKCDPESNDGITDIRYPDSGREAVATAGVAWPHLSYAVARPSVPGEHTYRASFELGGLDTVAYIQRPRLTAFVFA